MRRFICANCGHELSLPFGNGQSGKQAKCPQCGGLLHRGHCVDGDGFRGKFAGGGSGKCRRGGAGKGGR